MRLIIEIIEAKRKYSLAQRKAETCSAPVGDVAEGWKLSGRDRKECELWLEGKRFVVVSAADIEALKVSKWGGFAQNGRLTQSAGEIHAHSYRGHSL